jgi:hypothetical protein
VRDEKSTCDGSEEGGEGELRWWWKKCISGNIFVSTGGHQDC